MIFRNEIYLTFIDIYTNNEFNHLFFEEIYHLSKDKKPFDNYTKYSKIIQFLNLKGKNYLYINIPKIFFVDSFEIEIVFDPDLIEVLNLKRGSFYYKFDINKNQYNDKFNLFKDISIEINMSKEEVLQSLADKDLTDLHPLEVKPVFTQYKLPMPLNNNIEEIDNPTSFNKDILLNFKKLIRNSIYILDYVSDYDVVIEDNGIFHYEKFLLDNKIVLVTCCSMLVDYNLPLNFTKLYI